ncbi:MAG: histidine kinase [Rhodocyclales bacterium]|nr:histidine kinase [Rhodocyclales bacterium]MDB5888580.1 histidine kinase [Rhodocyclales bacterium]
MTEAQSTRVGEPPPHTPSIDDIIIRFGDLPGLPAVAADLVSSMDDDDLDLSELVTKIECDQALATKIVRVANSPFFGMMGKVSSVHQAATVIGLRTIRSLALASAMSSLRPQAGAPGIDLHEYWLHAFQTALASREIARAVRFGHDQAFLAGLIHDIGKLVLAVLYPDLIEKLAAKRAEMNTSWSEAERALGLPSHGSVGAALAKHWHFPETLYRAIEGHHPPFDTPDRITDIVHIADALAVAYCAARTGKAKAIELNGAAFKRLSLSDAQLRRAVRALSQADDIAMQMSQERA